MTAKCLDQIGLVLGFISGLLLIPEIINVIARLEKPIEKQLNKFELWTKFPLRFSPPSWKYKYTDAQREAIEPLTAIRSLIFSVAWIALLVIGILLPSTVFVLLSQIILIAVVIGNMRKHIPLLPRVSVWKKIYIFFGGYFLIALLTPIVSLIRVIFLILQVIVTTVNNFFSKHDVLRNMFLIVAIIFFILSNILQFWATLI